MGENDGRTVNSERETRILDAAARLMAHYGYDKTTVSDIAREAGISKGAIYLHHSSKEDLFAALLLREQINYTAAWLERFENDATDWSFAQMFKSALLTIQDYPFMLALLRRDTRVLGSYMRHDTGMLHRKSLASTELFTTLQAVGAVRDDIDAPTLAHLMNMFAVGFVHIEDYSEPGDMLPFEVAMEGLGKLLDRALMPADGGDPEASKAIIHQIVAGMHQQLAALQQTSTQASETKE
jgi:TetR/AcrR family acrAB operon transcriptional repressor